MKVSIITIVYNNAKTIEETIRSVLQQDYNNIEYIIVDGGSNDGTLKIINKHRKYITRFISEPDNGIYDAMNKGLGLSCGDIIGILNSDDFYINNSVIGKVVKVLAENQVDSCYADALYVDKNDINKVKRYWKSDPFLKKRFKYGWMPQHSTFFVKRSIYEKYGLFRLNMPIAADYELMLRFLYKHEISTKYIPEVLVKIRVGGKSSPSLIRIFKNMIENHRAWKINNLDSTPLTFLLKPFLKIPQYFIRF
jgi:glycosyltransferase